jgi:hypothetical protein
MIGSTQHPCLSFTLKVHQGTLRDYVDYIIKEHFNRSATPCIAQAPKEQSDWAWNAEWSDAANGQKTKDKKTEPTVAEKRFRLHSQFWLIGAGLSMLAYVLLSGQYVKIDLRSINLNGDEEDEEEEDT